VESMIAALRLESHANNSLCDICIAQPVREQRYDVRLSVVRLCVRWGDGGWEGGKSRILRVIRVM
jgi:hypothetical protein